MARLFIIDHSLKGGGGHHLDYTLLIANAAIDQGLETVVGTHRKFKQHRLFPASCQLRNVFRNTTYCPLAHFEKARKLSNLNNSPEDSSTPIDFSIRAEKKSAFAISWQNMKRQRIISQFSSDLDAFFRDVHFQTTDHVFLTTVSEIDLAGLAMYLNENRETLRVQWHLQFHFNLFVGRTPEYEFQQDFVAQPCQQINETLEELKTHHYSLYATSETLVRQFKKLDIQPVTELTYPVNPEFQRRADSQSKGEPLRVTFAGGVRQEKGQAAISQLVNLLWDDLVKPERIKLVVQRKHRHRVRKQQLALATNSNQIDPETLESVVQWVRYPLPKQEYADLICESDVGMLLYDSRAYYSRRAGILGEYLTAGIPVMVQAGCWLSEQIAEPNFEYVDWILAEAQRSGNANTARAQWKDNAAAQLGQLVVGDRPELQPNCFIETSGKSSGIVLGFDFLEPTESGYYLKMEIRHFDQFGNELLAESQVTGIRHDKSNRHFIRLTPETHDVEIRFSNAYEDSLILLSDISITHLVDQSVTAWDRPLGAVGLIAADLQQSKRLLTDMVENYQHYRQTADAFSSDWFERHNPVNTVRQLIGSRVTAAAA